MSQLDKTPQKHDAAFGSAIRLRRNRLGVTLDQLSEQTGISTAVLSRVERGHHSPTLHNALSIAQGLGCELMELLQHDPTELVRAGEHLRLVDKETGIERITLAHPNPSIELLKYIVPPDMTSRRFAAHESRSQEVFHILQGTLEIHTARKTLTLQAGDTATVLVDMEHWFRNIGSEPAHFVLMIMGG